MKRSRPTCRVCVLESLLIQIHLFSVVGCGLTVIYLLVLNGLCARLVRDACSLEFSFNHHY